jgi:hypothetical protein
MSLRDYIKCSPLQSSEKQCRKQGVPHFKYIHYTDVQHNNNETELLQMF